jgi:hypothetical protein
MVSAWSTPDLTQCPHNAAHSVAPNSTSILQAARISSHVTDVWSSNSTSYTNVCKFFYQGSTYFASDNVSPKYLKVTASVAAGTFDIRLIDSSNNVLWSSTSHNNTTDQTFTFDFDTITVPANEIILSLQAKSSGSTCTVSDVTLFSRFVPE